MDVHAVKLLIEHPDTTREDLHLIIHLAKARIDAMVEAKFPSVKEHFGK